MSRYTVNAKHPVHSLKHHRLAQLLINRGLAENNPAPVINPQPEQQIPPPVNPQQEEQMPQPEEQMSQPEEQIPQQEEEMPQSEQHIPFPESPQQEQASTQAEHEEEIPYPFENILQQKEGIPEQTEQNSEQKPQEDSEKIKQMSPLHTEDIQRIPEPPMQAASPPAKSTPSTPILSISTDESEDNIPIDRLKRK